MFNRIKYIDNLKSISILLVIYCHYVLIDNKSFIGNIFMLLAWCAVPIFFMCSDAMLLNKKNMNLKKNCRNLFNKYYLESLFI